MDSHNAPQPRVFAYIIRTVGPNYELTGTVPWVCEGKVFFGPCKRRMRPEIRCGDYIMGISPANVGVRRVLLWMHVDETMTFARAYERGESERLLRLARGGAIHVRPKRAIAHEPGNPATYEHIPGADHSQDWQEDIRGSRDVFLSGAGDSWAVQEDAQSVNEELVKLIQTAIGYETASVKYPLTKNARGKHAVVSGSAARRMIAWVAAPHNPVHSSGNHIKCKYHCSCE